MKTRNEQIEICAKKDKLLPIGSRVVCIYPKQDSFMKTGTIVSYYEKSPKGGFYWDYMVKLENGDLVYHDKENVEAV